MKLNDVRDNPVPPRNTRVGRGIGSNRSKQSGRGGKGQTARVRACASRISKAVRCPCIVVCRSAASMLFSTDLNEVNPRPQWQGGRRYQRRQAGVRPLIYAAKRTAKARDGVKILG